jgi:hypothetical protein
MNTLLMPKAGVLVAIVLAGCGSASREATPSNETSRKREAVLKVSRDNPCSVMFPAEVGQILGRKAEMREVMDEVTCRYHFEPAAEQKSTTRGETFIEVKVHWSGGPTAVTAARLAGRLLGGGEGGVEKLSGVGDEAWLAPMASYICFLKGDVGVEMDMRMMPGEKEKTIRLAQLVASRI